MGWCRGDCIAYWKLKKANSRDVLELLEDAADIFSPVFSPEKLQVFGEQYHITITNFGKKIENKEKLKSHFGSWPKATMKGNIKISTPSGKKTTGHPSALELNADTWPGPNGKADLTIKAFSDDWFLSTTDTSSLESFNKCLAQAKEKLQPEELDVGGPADFATMKFAGLFNEKGFDLEKIRKFQFCRITRVL